MSLQTETDVFNALPDFCRAVINDPSAAEKRYEAIISSPIFAKKKLPDQFTPNSLFNCGDDFIFFSLNLLRKLFPSPSGADVSSLASNIRVMFQFAYSIERDQNVQIILVTTCVKLLQIYHEFDDIERKAIINILMRIVKLFSKNVAMMELACTGLTYLFARDKPEEESLASQIDALVKRLEKEMDSAEDVVIICDELAKHFGTPLLKEMDVRSITNLLQIHSSDNAFSVVTNKAIACLLAFNKDVMARLGFSAANPLASALKKYFDSTPTFDSIAKALFALLDNNPEVANQLWDPLAADLIVVLEKKSSDKVFMIACSSILRRLYEHCDEQVAEIRDAWRPTIIKVFDEYKSQEDALIHLSIIRIRGRKPDIPIPQANEEDDPYFGELARAEKEEKRRKRRALAERDIVVDEDEMKVEKNEKDEK